MKIFDLWKSFQEDFIFFSVSWHFLDQTYPFINGQMNLLVKYAASRLFPAAQWWFGWYCFLVVFPKATSKLLSILFSKTHSQLKQHTQMKVRSHRGCRLTGKQYCAMALPYAPECPHLWAEGQLWDNRPFIIFLCARSSDLLWGWALGFFHTGCWTNLCRNALFRKICAWTYSCFACLWKVIYFCEVYWSQKICEIKLTWMCPITSSMWFQICLFLWRIEKLV